MNRTETIKVMAVLRGAYPQFYRQITKVEAEDTVALWQEMFSDEPYQLVTAAVKALIASDTKGFPPVIGQVKDKIRLISKPREMTEAEAWAQVKKALGNSSYGSEEEYAKLSPIVQHLVGSPAQLREWARMDSEEVETVVASNFQRSFRNRAGQEREWQALPGPIKDLALQLTGSLQSMPELPETNDRQFNIDRDSACRRLLEALP